MFRRLTAAVLLAVSTAVAIGTAAPAQASNAATFLSQINADRAKVGRAPLVHKADLAANAQSHAQTMATKNTLHHNGRLNSQVRNWMHIGENVGYGGNARALHAAFMNSPAHRANILDRDYTEIGLGVVVDARGVMWVTEVFRRPMRSTVRATNNTSGSSAPAAKAKRTSARRPAAKKRPATKKPAVRWVARPAAKPSTTAKSAWITRLSTAATSQGARPGDALNRAVDYLHVVGG